MKLLVTNHLINEGKLRFIVHKSIEMYLLFHCNDSYEAVVQDIFFGDFAKAVDKVNCGVLLEKLRR